MSTPAAPPPKPADVLRRVLLDAQSTSVRMGFRSSKVAIEHAFALRAAGIVCGRDRDSVYVSRSEFERLRALAGGKS